MGRFCVDVCIPTYKRPDQLDILLRSLALQRLDNVVMRVLVIDNDQQGSARSLVRIHQKAGILDLCYDIEPRPGVSYVRNHALEMSTAPFVAFLDDDEYVGADWLMHLLAVMFDYEADVVAGRVCMVLPEKTPPWLAAHSIFRNELSSTGSVLDYCGFGNVIIRIAALGIPPQRVDPAYALTGGEDTEFFFRLKRAGCKIISCAEAVAYEPVPQERATLHWILQRSYRSGQTYYRVFLADMSRPKKLVWVTSQLAFLLVATVLLLVCGLFSKAKFVQLLSRASKALGRLSGLGGNMLAYREYEGRSRKG